MCPHLPRRSEGTRTPVGHGDTWGTPRVLSLALLVGCVPHTFLQPSTTVYTNVAKRQNLYPTQPLPNLRIRSALYLNLYITYTQSAGKAKAWP